MKVLKQVLIGLGTVTGIYAAYAYYQRLQRASAELQSTASVLVHKLDLSGLTIRIDVKLKNPTTTSFNIKFPFVKLIYKDAVIGSSQAINKDITLPAYGEALIDQIMINIPVLGLFSLGAGVVSSLTKGESIKVNVITMTTINLGWKQLPYQRNEEITLKK
jgi:hypothetical protein